MHQRAHDGMVGLSLCLTLAEVDGGWGIGKAVGRGLTDMIFNMHRVQGERHAGFTKADFLGLICQAQEWYLPQKPGGKSAAGLSLLMSMHSPC